LRLYREVRNWVARIAGGSRRRHPALGVAQCNVGDCLARLQLNVSSAKRSTVDERLRFFTVRIKDELSGFVDGPLPALLMNPDSLFHRGWLASEKLIAARCWR
jgi:hypothetical protein